MRRRALLLALGGTAALRPLGAVAQQPKIPVVGCLFIANPGRSGWWLDAWRKGLADADLVEGRNIAVDYRWAEGDVSRLPGHAAALVARPVAAIVTTTESAVTAAVQATATIPIVFNNISDPVGKGLVKSFTEPGGNVTGIAGQDEGALESKRVQMLHEIVPGASRIGYLVAQQDAEPRQDAINAVLAAGKALGVEVILMVVSKVDEIDATIAAASQRGIGAVLVQAPGILYVQQRIILESAVRHRLPIVSGNIEFAEQGGLMQYGPLRSEFPYLTAGYIARILKGQNPAHMPVQHNSKFEFAINLRTARAFGLTIPPAILARADKVIE